MSPFKKNLQKFFIYFFTSTSVVIVVLGASKIKKTETTFLGNDSSLPDKNIDTSGIVVIEPSKKTSPALRGSTQTVFTGKTYQTPWGNLATAIQVKDGKVVAVTIPTLPDSPPSIYAESYLVQQALDAGSANIQGVSGATYTSRAFKASLESAISKAAAAANTSVAQTTRQATAAPGADQIIYLTSAEAPVVSTPVTSAPTQTDTAVKTTSGVNGTFVGGTVQTPYGSASASITVTNGKITGVKMPQVPNSPPSIYAEPYLIQQALAAGSANIQGVSGATYTSLAFKSSLESAIAKANNTANIQGQTVVTATSNQSTVSATASTPSIPLKYHRDDRDDNEWDD